MGRAIALLALPWLLNSTAHAQNQSNTNEDIIIVEGTRLGQTLREAGTAATVITAEDLEDLGVNFAFDALAIAPGVTINQNGAFGGVASVRVRGAASDQTLVLVDGVPVGDPSAPGGGFDFSRLDSATIERIEILRGPQSTLWGSEAIGGVISITTKTPSEDLGADVFAEIGSFNTFRGGGSINAKRGPTSLRIAATGLASDGISRADESEGNTEDDGYRSTTLNASGGYDLPTGGRLSGSVLYTDAETEFDSFDFAAPGFVADGDERSETEEVTAHIKLDQPLFGERLQNRILIGRSTIDRANFASGVESFSARGERVTLRYQGTAQANDRVTVAFGAEGDLRDNGESDTSIISGFGLAEIKPVPGLTISGGVRLDDHETFGSETTGRAALAYDIAPFLTLRSTWGEGFRAPSLFQETFFCCSANGPNTDLMPERSEGFDVGLIFTTPRLSLDVGYFDLDTEDLITFSFADGGFSNIDQAETRGIELSGSADLLSWLDLDVSYTWTEAEDGNGAQLIRVPEHTADAALNIAPYGPWSTTLLLRYNGEEVDGGATVDDWLRLDITGRYALTDRVELYARGENLTNTEYQQILGFGTPGRSGQVGIRIKL